jgi:hypothetical protein
VNAADLTLILFAACNALRIAAYVPQMLMLVRRPAAAAAFSHGTWALFGLANVSTALYAGVAIDDVIVCVVHALSALCCGALIGLALWRRGAEATAPRDPPPSGSAAPRPTTRAA